MKPTGILTALLLWGGAMACDGQAPKAVQKPAHPLASAPSGSSAAAYEVRGVLDPGINNMVAFALKIPRGWHFQQSFQRAWNGAMPINIIHVVFSSPDQHNIVHYLPEASYHFSDGPLARSLAQSAASIGSGPIDPTALAPMHPLAYIKNILVPQLAKAGSRVQVTGEKASPVRPLGAGGQQSSAYVDGLLPTGQKVRLETLIQVTPTQVNSDTYYYWTAYSNITQSDTDLEACYAYNLAAQKSLVLNPAWEQLNQQLLSQGQQSNNTETQKRMAINKDLQDYTSKIRGEVRANRNAAQDRQSEAFGDYIRGQSTYEDPTTGQRMKVQDGDYSHIYHDNQGHTLGTYTALDPGHVNWQELQRVEARTH